MACSLSLARVASFYTDGAGARPTSQYRTFIIQNNFIERTGGRNEPEPPKTHLRDMPMRQGEIGGSRPADSDRLLLLRELPRSRKSLRATAFRATRPQSRRWNRLRPISKGSSAMCDGAGVS